MKFIYRGKRSDDFFIVNSRERGLLPPITTKLLEVDGRKGAYDFGSNMGVHRYNMKATVTAESSEELEKKLDDIKVWLYNNGKQAELIFEDKPQVSYQARLDGDTPINPIGTSAEILFTFLCAEPIGEGITKVYKEDKTGIIDVNNDGTDVAYPKIKVKFSKDAHIISVTNGNEVVTVGKPEDVTKPTIERRTRIFDADLTSIANWTQGVDVDGGAIRGDFVSNGFRVHQKDWDYGKYHTWHGAAKVIQLPEEVQDITADLSCTFKGYNPNQMGRVEMYFLDKNRKVLGKSAIMDPHYGLRAQIIESRAGTWLNGGKYFIKSRGAYNGYWNDWHDGMIVLSRIEDRWEGYFCIYHPKTGHHTYWHFDRWYDVDNKFGKSKVAAIQLHIGAYGDYEPYEMYINGLTVFRHNINRQETDNDIAFIKGDELEIDCESASVFLNGKPAMHLLDPSSDFFSIVQGNSQLGITPDLGSVEVSFSKRHL